MAIDQGLLSGTVTNASGKPAANKSIAARANGVTVGSTTTNARGKYAMTLPYATYDVLCCGSRVGQCTVDQAAPPPYNFTCTG